jgi:hypothetical protein
MLQEAALAKKLDLQLGPSLICWDDAMRFLRVLGDRLLFQASDLAALHVLFRPLQMDILRKQLQSGYNIDLRSAFHQSRSFESTDPRDRLYSLRGLLVPEVMDLIVPNYHQQHDAVFRDVSRSIIHHMGKLDWLSFARPTHETVDLFTHASISDSQTHLKRPTPQSIFQRSTLPTWAVDWTQPFNRGDRETDPHDVSLRQLDTPEHQYHAAGDTLVLISPPHDDQSTLTLRGKRVGTVTSHIARGFQQSAIVHADRNFPNRPMEQSFLFAYLMCLVAANTHFSSGRYPPTDEPVKTAVWRTLVGDRWCLPGQSGNVRPDEEEAGDGERQGWRVLKPPPQMEQWFGQWIEMMKEADPKCRYRWSHQGSDRYFYELYREAGGKMGIKEQDEVLPATIVWRSMGQAVLGRCFCIVEGVEEEQVEVQRKDYMALCPPVAREGDVVVVFYGGNVAYVLRRVDLEADRESAHLLIGEKGESEEERRWQYLGEAYVHGVMEGEIFGRQDVADEVFHIA